MKSPWNFVEYYIGQCLWNMVLEKTPESPRDSKEINQSILREINPEYLLEGLMLKLNLQYFGHLMWTVDSLEKSVMLGKIEGRRGHQRVRWLDDITNAMDMNSGKLREMVKGREAWDAAVCSYQPDYKDLFDHLGH